MAKHFIFGDKQEVTKEAIIQIQKDNQSLLKTGDEIRDEQAKAQLLEEDNLVHTEDRIVVKLDIENKYSWAFESGQKIRYERNFNNFNRRETQPVNVIVISGEGIPKDAEMLVDHNALHETNRINDYKNSFENDGSDRVRYFSIPIYECYAWREKGGEFHPMYPFDFALRIFEPYKGLLEGIEPKLIENTLYVTSGELKGNVVKTVLAADYQIIFQDTNGRENNLIVFRPFGNEKRKMPEEAEAILHDKTEQINKGKLLVGYSIKDAKPINEHGE